MKAQLKLEFVFTIISRDQDILVPDLRNLSDWGRREG